MAVDTFGITKLYPTKTGAREWFSNWHNSTSRAFRNADDQSWSFPVVSGQNQDPQDPEFLSMAGGPTAWFIDGQSGIAVWKQELNPPVAQGDDPPSCRPHIVDIHPDGNAYEIHLQTPPRKTWQNIEMTCYGKFIRHAMDAYSPLVSGSFMRLSARKNHFNIHHCNCDAKGYDFNLICNPADTRTHVVRKEIVHPNYSDDSDGINVAQSTFPTIPSYSRFANVQKFPLLRWVGMKLVVRNIAANGYVRVEGYRDMTNGYDGGQWAKLVDLTDDGIDMHWGFTRTTSRNNINSVWASPGGCGTPGGYADCIDNPALTQGNYNPIVSRAGYSCDIRIDSIGEIHLKKFSIREIDPL